MAVSQLGGFNSLMYYSPLVFSLVGFANPVAVGTVVAGVNFAFTIVNLLLVDRVGRRRLLLSTVHLMAVALVVAAVCFRWIRLGQGLEPPPARADEARVQWPAVVLLLAIVAYVALYSSGLGNTAWLGSEFFPTEMRAMGTMMLTVTCWASNIVVSSTFLTQVEKTTFSGAFGCYAGVCILGWVFVYFCYPEVKGMALEDTGHVFQHGFGVKRAAEIQKNARAAKQNDVPEGA
ncbi:hypothetical protein CDD83_9815 [Cordyceps sp. RAO-2017]|nr:hypothetical protein CDD83_9815 [Cordyceps sp. RAO-2017]